MNLNSGQSIGPHGTAMGLLSDIGAGHSNTNLGDYSFVTGINNYVALQDDCTFMVGSGNSIFYSVGSNTAAIKTIGKLNLDRYQPVHYMPNQQQIGTLIHLEDNSRITSNYCSTITYERPDDNDQLQKVGTWSYFPSSLVDWKHIINSNIYPNITGNKNPNIPGNMNPNIPGNMNLNIPGNISCALDILAHNATLCSPPNSDNIYNRRILIQDNIIDSTGHLFACKLQQSNDVIIEIVSSLLHIKSNNPAIIKISNGVMQLRNTQSNNSQIQESQKIWITRPTINNQSILNFDINIINNELYIMGFHTLMYDASVRGYMDINVILC